MNLMISCQVQNLYERKEKERINANKEKELAEIRAQLCKEWGIKESL